MSLPLLLIVLGLAVVLTTPQFPYSRGWGWYPSGALGMVLVVVLVLLLLGVFPHVRYR